MDSKAGTNRTRRLIIGAIGLGAIFTLLIGAWMFFGGGQGVPQVVLDSKEGSAYPLFYPQPMPAGYKMVEGSFKQTSTATMFNVTDDKGNMVIVTEQQKPPLTEELKQTKQFSTPAGKAYLADLNGRPAGIINADSTLIIASPAADSFDPNKLQTLLTSFSRL